jgi:hypothetical protein
MVFGNRFSRNVKLSFLECGTIKWRLRNLNLDLLLDFMAVNNKPLGAKCVKMCMRVRTYIINTGRLKILYEILFIGQHLITWLKCETLRLCPTILIRIEYRTT